jgi:serine/threonine-protein kinase
VGATPAPEGADPEIGGVIGDRYKIVELLGQGGMGAVYRAEHLQLGKSVAIKLLRPEISQRRDSDARFQREAIAGARLQHPNVVGVIDFGNREDGSLYLVMEMLTGESLRDVLDKQGRLPWKRAVHIARHVLRGLAHAHDQGVIHRDIKPENIYLCTDGEDADVAKLLDFGIAMLTEGQGADVRITAAGMAVGTPTYLAPEQAVGGQLGPPTDLYSLSIVLYEMLAGRPPFVSDEPVRLLTAHAMTDPPPIAELTPDADVPAEIETAVRRGLAKTWSERVQSAAEYAGLLDEARRIHATPDAGTPVPFARSGPVVTPAPVAVANTAYEPKVASRAAGIAWWRRLTTKQLRLIAMIAGGIVALAIVIAVIAAATSDDPATASGAPPIIVVPTPVPVPSAAPGVDRETAYKAALHDLSNGKTCADRQKAVGRLRALGDERAIPLLKRARYRMRGGVLGIGDSNTNACLKKDAEAAIRALGGEVGR